MAVLYTWQHASSTSTFERFCSLGQAVRRRQVSDDEAKQPQIADGLLHVVAWASKDHRAQQPRR